MIDDVPFAVRLVETIAWCAPRALVNRPSELLRTPTLQPPLLSQDRETVLWFVVSTRAPHTRRSYRGGNLAPATDLAGGRLLGYWPDYDLCCGASQAESDGFFDVFNTPPWDTWVALVSSPRGALLVSWVPPYCLALADRGVAVNPEQCIDWLDESDWIG